MARRGPPDVVCMQETKLADDAFPSLSFQALGYESAHYGEGRWNGVAIPRGSDSTTRRRLRRRHRSGPEARHRHGTCGGIAGVRCTCERAGLDHDHYQYKL